MKKLLIALIILFLGGLGAYYYQEDLIGIYNQYQQVDDLDEREEEIKQLIDKFENLVSNVDIREKESFKEVNLDEMKLTLPTGFSINVFAQGLGVPRDLELGPNRQIHVSVPPQGKVFALPDFNENGIADQNTVAISNLNLPHGLATHCSEGECKMFVAETNVVKSYDYNAKKLKLENPVSLLLVPGEGVHRTRSIVFLPAPNEDKFLITVGSSCDVCEEKDWRHAAILIANADGSGFRTYAKGTRNSVFMTLHPRTGEVWATEMGRDLLGDELPPDEVNIIEDGKDYGWPFCYGKNIHDVVFDPKLLGNCLNKEPSDIDIPAHSAPLGLAFFPDSGWPEEYKNDLLVAYHGSWNRSAPTGYKIVRMIFDDDGNYQNTVDFITGWLTPDGTVTGRLVDLLLSSP